MGRPRNEQISQGFDFHLVSPSLSSRRRPCLWLVLLPVSIRMNTFWFSYRGLSPHKFTPMLGIHQALKTGRLLRGLPISTSLDANIEFAMAFNNSQTTQ